MTLTARCTCGAVTATTRAAPDRIGACHCLDCQDTLNAPYYAAAIFSARDVATTGPLLIDDQGWGRCITCNTILLAQTDDEIELLLTALGPDHGLKPTYEFWTIRRQRGVQPIPGATQHDRGG